MATSQWQKQSKSEGEASSFLPVIDEHRLFWSIYDDVTGAFDAELLDGWNKSLDILLIFAGLFSAINTAFIIESYKGLQPDPAETTNALLRFLIMHRHDDVTLTPEQLNTQSPNTSAIPINSIFFASLSTSLTAAFGIVTAKQWLNEYSKLGPIKAPHLRGRERQAKFKGLQTWKLRLIIELLPLLLQVSLLLFFIGVLFFLWGLEWKVAVMQLVLSVAGVTVYLLTILISIIFPTSPFQTPMSKHLPHYLTKLWRHFRPATSQRSDESKKEPFITGTGPGDVDDRGNGDIAAAESIIWMLEQAEHPDATIVALDASLRLPSDLLAALVAQHENLHNRLIAFNGSLFPSPSERLGDWRMLWPDRAVVSSVALFHILKAVSRTTLGTGRYVLPWHLKRPEWGFEQERWDDPAFATRAMLTYCLELVLGGPTSFNIRGLISDLKLMQSSLTHSLQLRIPLIVKTQASTTATLHESVDPFQLALEAIILAGFYDFEENQYLDSTFDEDIWRNILESLMLALRSKPSSIIISYTALIVATAQLWNWLMHPTTFGGHPSQIGPEDLKGILKQNVFGVDKSKSTLNNVVLALLLVDVAEFNPISEIHCQLLVASEALFPEVIRQGTPAAYSYLPDSLFRLSRKRSSDMDMQHLILRMLSKCKGWLPMRLMEHRDDLIRILDSALTPTAVIGDATQLAFNSLLSDLSEHLEDEPLQYIFTSAEGLFSSVSSIATLQNTPESFLRRLLSLDPARSSNSSHLLATQLGLSLKSLAEYIKKPIPGIRLPSSFLRIQYRFLLRFIGNDQELQWPAYFTAAQITNSRELEVQPDFVMMEREQMGGDHTMVYAWVGECILLLWGRAQKDPQEVGLPPDWNDSAFIEANVVDVILDYHKYITAARYQGFDVHTLSNYLRKALNVGRRSRRSEPSGSSGGSPDEETGNGLEVVPVRRSMIALAGNSGVVREVSSAEDVVNEPVQTEDEERENKIREVLKSLESTNEGTHSLVRTGYIVGNQES
ncbi:hypothetical protein FRC03_012211 [Tulasnella sp. 419]|nr:hypothetical protein FRC02_001236 [Tulasnella sp. 418]KAG8952279.1 hypothetical protein FRC03_012211 [Tulasnella sp. 419]